MSLLLSLLPVRLLLFTLVGRPAAIKVSSLTIFTGERVLFLYELASGYYSIGAYFLASITADLVPLRILPASFIALFSYLLRSSTAHFPSTHTPHICIPLSIHCSSRY